MSKDVVADPVFAASHALLGHGAVERIGNDPELSDVEAQAVAAVLEIEFF